jgi:hypothetical protein
MEQVIVSRFIEVKRHKPAVIFIPGVDVWWNSISDAAITTFTSLLRSIPPSDPVLLLATTECTPELLAPEILKELFGFSKKNRAVVERPERVRCEISLDILGKANIGQDNRLEFFGNIIDHLRKSPPDFPDPANRKKRVIEELPIAPPPPPRTLTKEEIKAQRKADLHSLNLLKMRLQPIMDQIHRKYRKFRQPVIPFAQIAYLFDEADPNFVSADLAPGHSRPFEIAKDREGTDGIRETATGKFFYNLESTTIEERLANGYYARPIDFYKDIKRLYLVAKNIGDRDRTLKANELRTNVEVDVHDIATTLANAGIRFDDIYERQMQRVREAEEKARKRKALQPVVDLIQSDIPGDGDSDSQGPVGIGLPMTRDMRMTTAARFQPIMSPESNGHPDTSDSHRLTNGTSVPSRPDAEDVHMSGLDDESQHMSGPRPDLVSPQWPHIGGRPPLGDSTRATAGTQYSQRSAVTSIPPGVSPSGILNDASSTKTSELSTNRDWSTQRTDTQRTNGMSHNADETSLLLDTQSNTQDLGQHHSGHSIRLSQSSSSGKDWAHSQAHAIERGILQPRMGMPMGPPPASASGSVRISDDIPSSSQQPDRKPSSASLGNILNEGGLNSNRTSQSGSGNTNSSGHGPHTPGSGSGSGSGPNASGTSKGSSSSNDHHTPSGPIPGSARGGGPNSLRQSGVSNASSQQPVINEGSVHSFWTTLADRTSGCSVEQLEQIYRELMDEIWKTRHEWNRMTVLNTLISVFNDTIGDIELVQGALVDSQKQKEAKGGEDGEVLDSVEGGGGGGGGDGDVEGDGSQGSRDEAEQPWVILR